LPTLKTFDDNAWFTIIDLACVYMPETKKRCSSTASLIMLVADAE
jgi:hypothetical protein